MSIRTTAERPLLLHSLFDQSAARWPDALALATPLHQFTYRELAEISERLSARVRREVVAPDDVVAIAAPKGWEQVAAVLAVLKAGAAYMPVDVGLPPARFRELVERARCRVLLTVPGAVTEEQLPAGLTTIEVSLDMAAADDGAPPAAVVTPQSLAYVLFTSGSTGVPKGVMIEHAGVVNTVCDLNSRFGLGPDDRILGLSSLSFDMSVYDMFGAFGSGGALILPDPSDLRNPAAWVELLGRYRVTVWNTVPMLLEMLISWWERSGDPPAGALRLAYLGGDWIPLDLPGRARAFFEDLKIVNIGGATEASICSCYHVVDRVDPSWTAVPYGRPLTDQFWRILRSDLSDCEVGETGEMYIGGVGVGRGYLHDPERTAESFITHPISGERLYRTGDIGRWQPDGTMELLGRRDTQVKVRGNRIELGEIEAHAQRYPGLRQAVVVAQGNGRHLDRMTLFAMADATVTGPELRRFLEQRLPGYMVPDHCQVLDAFPLTSIGKVDRSALMSLARSSAGADTDEPPVGDTETRVVALWRDIVPDATIGRRTDFFDLGGNSLSATVLAGRINREFGVRVSPAFVFAHPTIGGMGAALQQLELDDREEVIVGAGGSTLTFGQEQLWYFDRHPEAGRAYQFQASIRLRGDLQVETLQRALTAVVARHEILRTTYQDAGDELRPVVHPPYEVELVIEDLRTVPASRRAAALREAMDREIGRLFDLSQLPLIRWRLYRVGDDEWTLTEVEHHILHDGWSVAVLWREVEAFYTAWVHGQEPVLPALEYQFGDLAVRQRQDYQRRRSDLLDYWTGQLAGATQADLAIARRRPPRQTFAGASRRVVMDPQLYRELRHFATKQSCSLYVVMLAAYRILLHRYSGARDLSVGSWMANRLWPEAEQLIGMLVNMVVLRAELHDDTTVRQYLDQVRHTVVAAFDHQDAPFQEVVRAVNPGRDLSRNPLVQVCFSFHDSPVPEFAWPGVRGEFIEEHNGSAKFDLNLVVVPQAEQRRVDEPRPGVDHLVVVWEYNTDLFDAVDIDRMIAQYEQLLRGMLAEPDAVAQKIDFRTPEEKALTSARGPSVPYPRRPVPDLVLAQAAETPQAAALSCDGRSMSYAELAARVQAYTAGLCATGVARGDRVGVHLGRSFDLVACLLAVMATGAAYVPMDPTHPPARHRQMADIAGVKVAIHDGEAGFLAEAGVQVVTPDSLAEIEGSTLVDNGLSLDDIAYVIFTSGSTGRPKGVAVTHRSVVNLLWDMRQRLAMGRTDVLAAVTTVAFDISVLELFGPLTTGARVELVSAQEATRPEALAGRLRDSGATVFQATPTMWRMLLAAEWPMPTQDRFVGLCGGEPLRPDLAALILSRTTEAWNVYGPTETTVWSTAHRVVPEDGSVDSVPIGAPIANTGCAVVSDHGVPQPVGLPGELLLSGDGVAAGYVGEDELTERRFVRRAVGGGPPQRCFATGDLVRWNQHGELEFLRRSDTQVKLRGHRIEPGEVEAVLCAHPAVGNAAVVVEPESPDAEDLRLVAYVECREADLPAVRTHVRAHLPGYMEPQRFVVVDALPVTPSGKLDRARLAMSPVVADLAAADRAADRRDQDQDQDQEFSAGPGSGADDRELIISQIFCEVLGLGDVDREADFFELGGHSLLALRLAHRVRESLSIDIGLDVIFDHGSVRALAEVLGR
jgi:amino acid adenylation domain-containing protein